MQMNANSNVVTKDYEIKEDEKHEFLFNALKACQVTRHNTHVVISLERNAKFEGNTSQFDYQKYFQSESGLQKTPLRISSVYLSLQPPRDVSSAFKSWMGPSYSYEYGLPAYPGSAQMIIDGDNQFLFTENKIEGAQQDNLAKAYDKTTNTNSEHKDQPLAEYMCSYVRELLMWMHKQVPLVNDSRHFELGNNMPIISQTETPEQCIVRLKTRQQKRNMYLYWIKDEQKRLRIFLVYLQHKYGERSNDQDTWQAVAREITISRTAGLMVEQINYAMKLYATRNFYTGDDVEIMEPWSQFKAFNSIEMKLEHIWNLLKGAKVIKNNAASSSEKNVSPPDTATNSEDTTQSQGQIEFQHEMEKITKEVNETHPAPHAVAYINNNDTKQRVRAWKQHFTSFLTSESSKDTERVYFNSQWTAIDQLDLLSTDTDWRYCFEIKHTGKLTQMNYGYQNFEILRPFIAFHYDFFNSRKNELKLTRRTENYDAKSKYLHSNDANSIEQIFNKQPESMKQSDNSREFKTYKTGKTVQQLEKESEQRLFNLFDVQGYNNLDPTQQHKAIHPYKYMEVYIAYGMLKNDQGEVIQDCDVLLEKLEGKNDEQVTEAIKKYAWNWWNKATRGDIFKIHQHLLALRSLKELNTKTYSTSKPKPPPRERRFQPP